MKKIIILLFLSITQIIAQNGGKLTGQVLDAQTRNPLEFANLVLFNASDSTQYSGTVTDRNGNFLIDKIKPGKYYLRISFIGYDNRFINDLTIKPNTTLDLGIIEISPRTVGINDVVVSGERAPISYEIDKKVINVGQNIVAASGTAVDILENVPSITVDVEGNVSLRGSTNFRVLIDGRPSILDPNEILQQIPASEIENIEIITNPSAKYDPEGTAGIINIVMKKNKNIGLSGLVELNGGLKNKYGGEIITDLKSDKLDINLGLNYNKRNFGIDQNQNNWTNRNDIYTYYNSIGASNRNREYYGIRGSISYDFGNKKILTLGGRVGSRSFGGNSNLYYTQWNSLNTIPESYISSSNRKRSGNYYSLFFNYIHNFAEKGHQLTADISFDSDDSDEESQNNLVLENKIVEGKINTEAGPGKEFTAKLDYTLPLGGDRKFEAGYQGQIDISDESIGLLNYNPVTSNYDFIEEYSHTTKYNRNESAIYSLFQDKIGTFGYQFGLRAEYTGRSVEIPDSSLEFTLYRWDFFPSLHISYEIFEGNEIMTSYTRRINRPRGWEFEPFYTWMDAYNVRIGNPSLLPEYIDSYELGYQTLIGNTVFSVETYYRVVKNKKERVRSAFSDNVTLMSVQNVGTDYSLGTELFFNFDLIKNWNINLMGNLYNYRIEGRLNDIPFERSSFNWNVRFNNSIKLTTSTTLQFNLIYNSPSVSSQGRREAFMFTNLALKQEFLNKMLSVTLQVRDLFGTAEFEMLEESHDFYNYSHFKRESPIVMLNLRFNINNYKNNRRENQGEDMPQNGGVSDDF
ncbi:TonB-dependent receptor domain-containing protein [Melioribacter sp. Ez-97]|uniref:TonB-dependent receptor domain-containing protein n=1 Tax=Melioribacter sp. Ez-97 TaxID=3423434 RepID=UPI003EDA4250